MFKKLKVCHLNYLCSSYSQRLAIDGNLRAQFESKEFKPRKHPGSTRVKVATLPADLQKSIKIVLDDNDAKTMQKDSETLCNYLRSRLLPPEDNEIDLKAAKLYNKFSKRRPQIDSKAENAEKLVEEQENKVKTKVFNALKKNIYHWGSISYDKPTAVQYLMCRAAPEYSVLLRILDEIRRVYPDFKPRSFFDFGSGIGTGTWAVNHYWKGEIFEYFCVDTSQHMHDLARLILCKGRGNVELPYKGFFQRQFLPASTDLKYNIVLSAYSLFELPDMKSRLETIQKLWHKTEDFLIIVEQGTNAGFQIVNEAREFVLNSNSSGYAFSPCPNDNVCPRYMEHQSPCNFLMRYEALPYGCKSEVYAELFSYVVLKKGQRPKSDPQWPRIVRAPIVRSGHTICRLCTAQGDLKEVIFSKGKYDQTTYRCARSSNWGDLLPIK